MLVYLIRHGESEANRTRVISGQGAWPRSEKGVEQANSVGQRIKDLPPFDKIYVSDLLRTRQTFEYIFGDREHTLVPLIREINVGELTGQSFSVMPERYGEAYLRARSQMSYEEFGGESVQDITDRVKAFREMLEQEEQENHPERVAVVCHVGIIKTMTALAFDLPANQFSVTIANCSITVLEYKDGIWRLVQFCHTPEIIQ